MMDMPGIEFLIVIILLGTLLTLLSAGSSQGFHSFSLEVQEAMKKVNDYDRYMDGSGQYDDDESASTRSWRVKTEKYRKILTPAAKDFMEHTHWREWNNS